MISDGFFLKIQREIFLNTFPTLHLRLRFVTCKPMHSTSPTVHNSATHLAHLWQSANGYGIVSVCVRVCVCVCVYVRVRAHVRATDVLAQLRGHAGAVIEHLMLIQSVSPTPFWLIVVWLCNKQLVAYHILRMSVG